MYETTIGLAYSGPNQSRHNPPPTDTPYRRINEAWGPFVQKGRSGDMR